MSQHSSTCCWRKRWRALTISLAVAALSGCALSTGQRSAIMTDEGRALGFSAVRYGAAPPLAGMLRTAREPPEQENPAKQETPSERTATLDPDSLWVVIEGDGRAWLSMREPSRDPTPVDAVGWRLARNIAGKTVLYLARPCQYLSPTELESCSVADWTDARFSEKWVARLNSAIDQAKRSTDAKNIALAGYSGGGVMAALIAARRNDVAELITIAAPLDHAAWTALHGVTPLAASLSVVSVRQKLFGIPQVHITGAGDTVVPPSLMREFLRAYPVQAPARMIILPGIDHRMDTPIAVDRISAKGGA